MKLKPHFGLTFSQGGVLCFYGGKMVALALSLSIAFLFLGLSCKSSPPGPNGNAGFDLSVEDASCTEAWLRIALDSSIEPRTLTLRRDDTVTVFSDLRLLTSDTLVIDEGLLPNRTYNYTIIRPIGSGVNDSRFASATTMDTTSHNFIFQIDTLGTSSSVLHDVAILQAEPDSTLVYAVGELYHSDSSQSFLPFGVAVWNGQRWQLKRIYYNGTNIIAPIRGIWLSGPADIWLAAGSVFHWDGTSSQAQLSFSRLSLPDPNATVEKLWGSPSTGLYGVGNAGTIVHRDASGMWQRVESGTTLPIKDVYGARDNQGVTYEILAVAEETSPGGSKVLSIENMVVRELQTNGLLSWGLWGIWFTPNRQYIAVGDGLWQTYSLNGTWSRNNTLPAQYKRCIDGQGLNDVVVCGDFWLLSHNNGLSWQNFFATTSGSLGGVDIKGNLIIAVGFTGNRAVVMRGRR